MQVDIQQIGFRLGVLVGQKSDCLEFDLMQNDSVLKHYISHDIHSYTSCDISRTTHSILCDSILCDTYTKS